MTEENEKLERSIKAVRMVVMDLKEKLSELTSDVKQLNEALNSGTNQLNETEQKVNTFDQTLASLTEDLNKIQQSSTGIDPEPLQELQSKFETEVSRLNEIEQKFNAFDLLLTALREELQGILITLEETPPASPTESTDTAQFVAKQKELETQITTFSSKLTEVEKSLSERNESSTESADFGHKQKELETNLSLVRGKLVEFEESLVTLKATTSDQSPSIDSEQFNAFESKLSETNSTLLSLQQDLQGVQQKFEEIEPSSPTDTARSDKLEASQIEMDNKMAIFRGKLVEIEETLAAIKVSAPEASASGDTDRLDVFETRIGQLDSSLSTLQQGLQELQQKSEETAPPATADTSEIEQLASKQKEMENKITIIRGKIVEFEDTVGSLDITAPQAPIIDLNPIQERLATLEAQIATVKTPAPTPTPAPTSAPAPTPAPTPSPAQASAPVAPQPVVSTVQSGGTTLRDQVVEIINEVVTATAITIAGRLQVSTARVRSIVKDLENDGLVKISGDIETGRYEVRLI